MARPCSICGHPDRAAIDARLMGGASLNAVAAEFILSRPALQRHRAAHMGSTVTITVPAASPTAPAPISVGVDGGDALFARALAAPEYSLQDHVRLILYELRRQLASSQGREDRAHALRVAREMRAMVQFSAIVRQENLRQAPGWAETPTPTDPAHDLLALVLADEGGTSVTAAIGDTALASLDATRFTPDNPHPRAHENKRPPLKLADKPIWETKISTPKFGEADVNFTEAEWSVPHLPEVYPNSW